MNEVTAEQNAQLQALSQNTADAVISAVHALGLQPPHAMFVLTLAMYAGAAKLGGTAVTAFAGAEDMLPMVQRTMQ